MPSSLHSSNYKIFRSQLVAAREEAGFTQVNIAEKLEKPQSFVSKYERGERRLDFAEFVEIANILEIDIADFVNRYLSTISQTPSVKMRRKGKTK
jgi:transcriptional regulator with XRE-family HTH domain